MDGFNTGDTVMLAKGWVRVGLVISVDGGYVLVAKRVRTHNARDINVRWHRADDLELATAVTTGRRQREQYAAERMPRLCHTVRLITIKSSAHRLATMRLKTNRFIAGAAARVEAVRLALRLALANGTY